MSPQPGPIFAPMHQPIEDGVSVPDDSLDQMVQAASTPTAPSLATLFGRAKDAGLITGGLSNYDGGIPK